MANGLGLPGFLEALINVALGLRGDGDEVLTKERVVQVTEELIQRLVLPNAKRYHVLSFRALMLGSVPLLHAFDVLAEQLRFVHSKYATYDSTMDVHELLKLMGDSKLLGKHIAFQRLAWRVGAARRGGASGNDRGL